MKDEELHLEEIESSHTLGGTGEVTRGDHSKQVLIEVSNIYFFGIFLQFQISKNAGQISKRILFET
jgi:hypothetical protein